MSKPETTFALEHAAWPAVLLDSTGAVKAWSAGARKLFGAAIESRPNIAQSIWSRENEQTPAMFLSSWAEKSETPVELRFRGRDGSTCSYQTEICLMPVDGEELFLLQLFKLPPPPDLPAPSVEQAAAKEPPAETTAVLEASVAQKQKLDCAMQLIRTVALDFNNALTSVLGHASLLLGRTEKENPIRSSLVEIEKSAQKAAEIAHDLADFSRQEKDTRAQTSGNLNDLLRRTVEFFQETQPETLHFKTRLEPRPFTAAFDEAKMQQALIKILENSVQAMAGFGTIYVTTKNLEATETVKDQSTRIAPGTYLVVEIIDTGTGISEELLPRIFEPFFTTKKEQGHRGLGLAWVYGIVTNHGGSVAVSSELQKGTSVRVYLPAQKKVVHDRLTDSGDLTGHETILMIDDEDLLLTMGEMVLSSFGYRVLTANNGAKALEIFTQQADQIDLVITDLVMPQMSGRELIERLRRISPNIKVICASGFVRPPSSEGEENYLQKPFASQDLLRKVRQVLGVDPQKH